MSAAAVVSLPSCQPSHGPRVWLSGQSNEHRLPGAGVPSTRPHSPGTATVGRGEQSQPGPQEGSRGAIVTVLTVCHNGQQPVLEEDRGRWASFLIIHERVISGFKHTHTHTPRTQYVRPLGLLSHLGAAPLSQPWSPFLDGFTLNTSRAASISMCACYTCVWNQDSLQRLILLFYHAGPGA